MSVVPSHTAGPNVVVMRVLELPGKGTLIVSRSSGHFSTGSSGKGLRASGAGRQAALRQP
ncbi:hypothetical protein GCM10027048_17030 [Hymenobacter coalescens]